MDCLTNFIGLRNCGLPTPESGLELNILPGMSTELADKIANSEQVNFLGVYRDLEKRALLRLRDDIINAMADQVSWNEVVYQTRRLAKTTTSSPRIIPASSEHRGIYIMLPESKYSELKVITLYLYSAQIVTTTLKVWDLNDGAEVHTQNISLVEGFNEITIDKIFNLKYRIQEYFIGVDCSGVDTIESLPDYYYWYGNDWSCGYNCASLPGSRGIFQIYAGTLDVSLAASKSNLSLSSMGKGIAIAAEVSCSIDQFICDNRNRLAQAILYLYGAEMLASKLGSPRMNYFASTNLERTDALRAEYEVKYKSNLKRILKSIPLAGENICFNCDEQAAVSYKGSSV